MATTYVGYMGKILQIDLTTETVSEYPFSDQQREETLGGKILAHHILSKELTGAESPFSEENLLILSTGPLTGTGAPASIRFEITALSPKTGRIVSSNCGGNFGLHLKKAGFDAIILKGRSISPRWIEILDGDVYFHDASPLWGFKPADCQSRLKQMVAAPFGSLCIGPAGEDLLSSATVICDGKTVGRAGFGAVLGWKNVKVITASGNKSVPVSHPNEASAEIQKWLQILKSHPLTADPQKVSSCPGCPIRCTKPGKDADPVLNDLGIDSMDAENYCSWLLEKHCVALDNISENKSGQRRNKFYHSILKNLELEDCDEVFSAFQALNDIISVSGLCIFAVIACLNAKQGGRCLSLSDRLPQLIHGYISNAYKKQKKYPKPYGFGYFWSC